MSEIKKIYEQLKNTIENDPKIGNQLFLDLSKIVSTAYSQCMANAEESFCYKFSLPITSVIKLYTLLNLDQKEVSKAFQKDWNYPSDAIMYNDPYYHILMLLIYYGLKENKELVVKHSLTILLLKIWNGRKSKYLRFCDKRVMNYVVSNMVNNKHLISKYSTPIALITEYFVPTLIQKYGDEIRRDISRLKQLFMQCWVRVNQIFVFNMRENLTTGKKEAQGGILPLYMKAKQNNLYLSTKVVSSKSSDEDEAPSHEEYLSIHNRDEIIDNTANYITMNEPVYPPELIKVINERTKVSVKIIESMLKSMHNHQYYNLLHAILVILLSRTGVVDKDDICRAEFIMNVKKNIMSSKNTPDIVNLQKILDKLISDIFRNIGLSFERYSNTQQIQIRNVLLYGIIYNLRKFNCQSSEV